MTDITLAGITLPGDLKWTDEFTAWKVGRSQRISLGGALIVSESAQQAGRPITLETTSNGGGDYTAAITLDTLRALQALESAPRTTPMTLVMPDHNAGTRSFDVLFNASGGAAIEAEPLLFKTPYYDTDYFSLTLRLIQVEP